MRQRTRINSHRLAFANCRAILRDMLMDHHAAESTAGSAPHPHSDGRLRHRALLLVEECNPNWPSLPGVGYRAALALAGVADVTIATHIRNREDIESDADPLLRRRIEYIDTEYIAAPVYKLTTLLRGGDKVAWRLALAMKYPSRLAFDRLVWKRFGKELREGRFDVVQRITPMSPTLPSPIARRLGRQTRVPFVLGPLNGGLPWPAQFAVEQGREREKLPLLRTLSRRMPYSRSTYEHSDAVLAGFAHTINDLPAFARDRAIDFPEVGIDPDLFSAPPTRDASTARRRTVLYTGRLVPYKLPEVVVRAFAQNPALRKHRLLIVGDGPERPRLEALIRDHNLHGCVELAGNLPQARVGQIMRESDIFAFPSIRELGAGVVVEAMACGLPCVVVDYGGPAGLIGPDRGVKVPMGTRDELVDRYAESLAALVGDPQRMHQLGDAARRHATEIYAWNRKARKTLEVYDWVLGRRDTRPDFWTPVAAASEG